jgi:hypothetical protein
MTVRGFATAHGRTVEHGNLGGFSPAVVLEAERQLAFPYTAIGTTGGDAQQVGDLFDVRLDELRAVHEATLPVAFER